jgi:cytochrome c553
MNINTSYLTTMLRIIFVIFILALPFSDLLASSTDLNELIQTLEHKIKNNQAYLKAIDAGSERAYVCKFCHGKDGNSMRDHIPNLAQQDPKYLLLQFELFASRARENKIMSELADILSADDRVNIALYYASKKVRLKEPYRPELATTGKQLFNMVCASCHGQIGQGLDESPRIAGQPATYIIKTLTKYKSGKIARPDSPMQAVTQNLSSKNIESLASYLSILE